MGEKSCQPEGLQPERPLTLSRGLLIFAISAAPRFALSTVLAATHTCFIMLGTLTLRVLVLRDVLHQLVDRRGQAIQIGKLALRREFIDHLRQ